MTSIGEQTLRGIAEAAHVHQEFPHFTENSSFDLLGYAMAADVPVVFRPLKGLLGATVRVGDKAGILVTSRVGRPMQRFTLAHELGHVRLGHRASIDRGFGVSPWQYSDSGQSDFSQFIWPAEEAGANSFASELLASRDMIRRVSQRHGWTRESLNHARRIYQLSLRLGVSYQATCWALGTNQLIPKDRAAKLAEVKPQTIKQKLVHPRFLEDSWADVWELTSTDSETSVEAGPFDVFVLNVEEDASAGYIWVADQNNSELQIVSEESVYDDIYGDPSSRRIVLRFSSADQHRCHLAHKRPWNDETAETFDLNVDTRGKEVAGIPRRVRESALSLAA